HRDPAGEHLEERSVGRRDREEAHGITFAFGALAPSKPHFFDPSAARTATGGLPKLTTFPLLPKLTTWIPSARSSGLVGVFVPPCRAFPGSFQPSKSTVNECVSPRESSSSRLVNRSRFTLRRASF